MLNNLIAYRITVLADLPYWKHLDLERRILDKSQYPFIINIFIPSSEKEKELNKYIREISINLDWEVSQKINEDFYFIAHNEILAILSRDLKG